MDISDSDYDYSIPFIIAVCECCLPPEDFPPTYYVEAMTRAHALLLSLSPYKNLDEKKVLANVTAHKIVYDCSHGLSLEQLLDEVFNSFATDLEVGLPNINVYTVEEREALEFELAWRWRLYNGICRSVRASKPGLTLSQLRDHFDILDLECPSSNSSTSSDCLLDEVDGALVLMCDVKKKSIPHKERSHPNKCEVDSIPPKDHEFERFCTPSSPEYNPEVETGPKTGPLVEVLDVKPLHKRVVHRISREHVRTSFKDYAAALDKDYPFGNSWLPYNRRQFSIPRLIERLNNRQRRYSACSRKYGAFKFRKK